MSNKFKKAVEQRSQEISGESNIQEIPKKVEPQGVVYENEEETLIPTVTPTVEVKKKVASQPIPLNPAMNLFQEKKKANFKNKTLYLEIDVINSIVEIAKSKNLSESFIANEILKQFFNIK